MAFIVVVREDALRALLSCVINLKQQGVPEAVHALRDWDDLRGRSPVEFCEFIRRISKDVDPGSPQELK